MIGIIQEGVLSPSDGIPDGLFAESVAVSDDVIAVAGYSNQENEGTIYVFVKPNGGWGNLTQTAQLTLTGPASHAIGLSVAISGNTIVAGASGAGPHGAGAAYVFVKPAGGWVNMPPTAVLAPSDGAPGEAFGRSVAVSGGAILVGAPSCTGNGQFGHGEAYVFVRPPSGWVNSTETAILTASDTKSCDQFGNSVAIDGEIAAVGKPNFGQYPPNARGAAYIFVQPPDGWISSTETSRYTASDGHAGDALGGQVALTGGVLAASGNFAAYVFVEPIAGWSDGTETAKLSVPNMGPKDNVGASIAINSGVLMLGATGAGPNHSGEVFIFDEPPSGWQTSSTPNIRLADSSGVQAEFFGATVSMIKDTAVVGAPCATNDGNPCEGAAFVFGR